MRLTHSDTHLQLDKQQKGHPEKYAYNPPYISMSTHRPAQLHFEGRFKRHATYRGLSMVKAILIYTCLLATLVLILQKAQNLSFEDLLSYSPCSEQTLSTHTSPSALFTATIIEKNCGALTSYSHHVLIQNKNKNNTPIEIARFLGAYTESNRGVAACWVDDSTLTISYDRLRNYFIDKNTIDFWGFKFTIQIAEGKDSASIPCNESNNSTK